MYKTTFCLIIFFIGFLGCKTDGDEVAGPSDYCESNSNFGNCDVTLIQNDYCLNDVNPSSCTHGEDIGLGYFADQITLHYLGK